MGRDMDVDSIGAALRRKLGPLPIWIWAIFGGAVLYFLRKRGYFGGLGAAQGEALQPSQANATPPQSQVPLQPGESVYDPNTGALSTAPGGDGSGATGTDPSQAIDDLASAIAGGFTTTVKVDQATPAHHTKTPKKTAKGKSKPRKGGARKKPAHHQKPGHTTKHPPAGHKGRARSKTTHRNAAGGRTAPRKKSTERHLGPAVKPTGPKNRVYLGSAPSTARARPTVGITRRTAPVQHPVSSHPARSTATHPAPRPSAPPPRSTRRQAQAKPAPARRSRGKR